MNRFCTETVLPFKINMSSDNLRCNLEIEIEPENSKKIRLELENITEEIGKYKKHFDIKNEEIEKFLTIFLDKIKLINKNEAMDLSATDSENRIKDIARLVGVEILNFADQNFESLDLQNIIKEVFKVLKVIVTFISAIKNMTRTKLKARRNYSQRKKQFQHNQNQISNRNLRPFSGTSRKNIELEILS